MAFIYIRHIPSPPLDAYIDYLWYDEGRVFPREKLLPRATLHLVLNFGGPIQAYDGARHEPLAAYTESWVIGTWSECHVVNWPRKTQFYGVCFKAGAAYPFLQRPLAELHNQFVALDTLWGPFATQIRE